MASTTQASWFCRGQSHPRSLSLVRLTLFSLAYFYKYISRSGLALHLLPLRHLLTFLFCFFYMILVVMRDVCMRVCLIAIRAECSWWSFLTWSWLTPLLSAGFSRPLEVEGVYPFDVYFYFIFTIVI
jgi:hypothetical protein